MKLSRGVLRTLSRGAFKMQFVIYDGAFCENSQRLIAVNYLRKKAPS